MVRAAVVVLAAVGARASENGLARRPPLGWNSWNQFQCNVSDALIRNQADALVTTGLAAKGYEYVIIDDCWQAAARVDGRLAADAARFPRGIAAVADYVHARGLKLGIYSDVGTKTCQGFPGSFGHYDDDARDFAAWGVDYLKFDTCSLTWRETLDPRPFYANMSRALNATGRPILYSPPPAFFFSSPSERRRRPGAGICNWGRKDPWEWGPAIANMWRTTMDIFPQWHRIAAILDDMAALSSFGGPGGWNDADMVEVGVASTLWNRRRLPATNLTARESEAHFALWAVMGVPLILGLDVSRAEAWALDVVGNADVLAIDQDAEAVGRRVFRTSAGLVGGVCVAPTCSRTEVWAKTLTGGAVAVAFLNGGDAYDQSSPKFQPEDIAVDFPRLYIAGRFAARDVLAKRDLGAYDGNVTARAVPPHGVALLLLTPDP